ncbi:hypothetical protein [uncultured Sphingomonas sp.]|uniref:hypothetical protein n=1 Tax=uncultured Sphingomonas sp. TaxID=158754 RepID=UPI0035CC7943
MNDSDDAGPEKGPGLPDRDDPRSDIEQAVAARADAVARGEGGEEPSPFTAPGEADGVGGTGGEVKNDTETQQ